MFFLLKVTEAFPHSLFVLYFFGYISCNMFCYFPSIFWMGNCICSSFSTSSSFVIFTFSVTSVPSVTKLLILKILNKVASFNAASTHLPVLPMTSPQEVALKFWCLHKLITFEKTVFN